MDYIPDDKILIGASWYPEMWEPEEWPKDVARMKELGYTLMRLFEFAWHRFEPEEGKYDFDWAIQILDEMHKAGIQAMIGTPTAAPPAWLTYNYPEVLQTTKEGKRKTHGKRKHFNQFSKKYREFCEKIVTKMAEAFKDHPAVHSWQIDNEMSGYDYGPETLACFHEWLTKKYGDAKTLNETWGLNFWSQAYDSIDQVRLVTSEVGSIEIPERHHPSLIMAINAFNNDGWYDYIKIQCDAIRKHTDKPISSNMTPTLAMRWYQHNTLFDAVGHSMYKDLAHYHWNWMNLDRMRGEKNRPYWLMETAPNWSGGGRLWNIHYHAEGLKAMSWMSVLLGGSMILYWQFRQHWAGQEMQHGTLVTATGRWRPNKEAHQEVCAKMAEQSEWLMQHPPAPPETAILLNNEAAWAFSIDPIDDDMAYLNRWRDDHYQPLSENHIWRDVVGEEADFEKYKILIVPLMPVIKEHVRAKLKAFVEKGGHLIIGPVAGTRSEEFTVFKDHEFGGLEELIGATSELRFSPKWMEERTAVEFACGSTSKPYAWCEAFACDTATPLAYYRGGYGDGLPAIIDNRYGKGSVVYLGTLLEREAYLGVVRMMMGRAGVLPVAQAPIRVLVVPRVDMQGNLAGYGIQSLQEEPAEVTIPEGGTDRLTGRSIPAKMTVQPLETLIVEI